MKHEMYQQTGGARSPGMRIDSTRKTSRPGTAKTKLRFGRSEAKKIATAAVVNNNESCAIS